MTAMYVDYGQWPSGNEELAVEDVVEWCRKVFNSKMEMRARLSLILDEADSAGVGSVWGRGIALVGIAAMWAYTHGNDYDYIALGNHKGDVGPDCMPGEFDSILGKVLGTATKGKLQLLLPIRDYAIEQIGIDLKSYGVPFDILYNCYWSPNCQYKSENDKYLCPGCRRKILAMKAAGIPESELYPPNGGRTYQSESATKVSY